MKASEIKVGGHYEMKVNNKLTTVRVESIGEHSWRCTNLTTGRECHAKSASKFRREVKAPEVGAPPKSSVRIAGSQILVGEPLPRPKNTYSCCHRAVGSPHADDCSLFPKLPTNNLEGPGDDSSSRLNVPARSLSSVQIGPKLDTGTEAHLIVQARAGTGKTTTLVEGLRFILGGTSTLVPSPQQKAVWDEMAKSARPGPLSVCFVAFNKAIATELQNRVPRGCDAMTMHSMGFKAVMKVFGQRIKVEGFRVQNIISDLLGRDIRELRKEKFVVLVATEKLVGLCKMNLVGADGVLDIEKLDELVAHYDIDLNGDRDEVYALVPRVLERCKDASRDGQIDFNDMIWLPIVLNLPLTQYDVLLVDEAQDLNRCQQALAKRAGKRLILCGDPKQAIYGFAGADSQSMPRMAEELGATKRGCVTLPLTVTRRCGKAIVAEANTIVPDFEAFETNPPGLIDQAPYKSVDGVGDYTRLVKDGDFILCRVNAPLVSQCFRFLKQGRKANIQGRDIGQGLITLIKKMKTEAVDELVGKLDDYFSAEEKKEMRKRNPSEAKLIALQDRHDCLSCFCEGESAVSAVIARIESIFTDDRGSTGIRLSSIHKAKGLESDRVFLINTEDASCPHPMAKTKWQVEQEYNLLYVAITRAKLELIYVV